MLKATVGERGIYWTRFISEIKSSIACMYIDLVMPVFGTKSLNRKHDLSKLSWRINEIRYALAVGEILCIIALEKTQQLCLILIRWKLRGRGERGVDWTSQLEEERIWSNVEHVSEWKLEKRKGANQRGNAFYSPLIAWQRFRFEICFAKRH